MEKFLLNHLVEQPTRMNNILDLFITNREDVVLEILSFDTSLSDHKLVKIPVNYCFDAQYKKPLFNRMVNDKSFNNLDFTKAYFKSISNKLDDIDWDDLLLTNSDPESFYNAFHNIVLDICHKLVPEKHLKAKQKRHSASANRARKK